MWVHYMHHVFIMHRNEKELGTVYVEKLLPNQTEQTWQLRLRSAQM